MMMMMAMGNLECFELLFVTLGLLIAGSKGQQRTSTQFLETTTQVIETRSPANKTEPNAATKPINRVIKEAQNDVTTATTTNSTVNATMSLDAATTAKPSTAFVLQRWSYDEMEAWGRVSPICSSGNRQSPISLTLEDAIAAKQFVMDPLLFKNYDAKMTGNLTNNEHYLVWQLDPQQKALPFVAGSGYGAQGGYVLDHVAFHWGGDSVESSCRGSDHSVEYSVAPMELHFVHRNSKYSSVDEAQMKSDGLAIVAFLFEAVSQNSSGNASLLAFADIAAEIPNVKLPNATVTLALDMTKLLPDFATSSQSVFFRYEGSQTSPPCFESVSWTVFRDRIRIPIQHLNAFRGGLHVKAPNWAKTLASSANGYQVLANNYRPIQMKNGRQVWTNGKGMGSSSAICVASNAVMLFSSFLFMYLK